MSADEVYFMLVEAIKTIVIEKLGKTEESDTKANSWIEEMKEALAPQKNVFNTLRNSFKDKVAELREIQRKTINSQYDVDVFEEDIKNKKEIIKQYRLILKNMAGIDLESMYIEKYDMPYPPVPIGSSTLLGEEEISHISDPASLEWDDFVSELNESRSRPMQISSPPHLSPQAALNRTVDLSRDRTIPLPQRLDATISRPQRPDATISRPQRPDATISRPRRLDATISRPLRLDATITRPQRLDATITRPQRPDATISRPQRPDATISRPQRLDATITLPQRPDATISRPQRPDATISRPPRLDATITRPQRPDATITRPQRPDATISRPQRPDATISIPRRLDTTIDLPRSSAISPAGARPLLDQTFSPVRILNQTFSGPQSGVAVVAFSTPQQGNRRAPIQSSVPFTRILTDVFTSPQTR